MSIFGQVIGGAGAQGETGGTPPTPPAGHEILNSVSFSSDDSAYLSRTPLSQGNRRTWTLSFWVKKNRNGGNPQQIFGQYRANTPEAENRFQLYFDGTTDQLEIHTYSLTHLKTSRVFRDNSAWYHIVLAVDTTLIAADTRIRMYVNGIEETSFATRNNPSLGLELGVNTDGEANIGTAPNAKSTYYADVNLAEINFIDGQALTPSAFGETNSDGIWVPIEYTGTYGNPYSSEVWSTASAADSYAFDGQTSYNASANRLYGTTTYHKIVDTTNTFTGVTSLIIGTSENAGDVRIDGTVYSTTYLSLEGLTVTNPPASFDEIEVLGTSGGLQISYVRVNGQLLIDSGVVAGNNSFYLPFSNTTTNQSLGIDQKDGALALDPRAGMDCIFYDGNGSTQSQTALGFRPDLVWTKSVNNVGNNALYDAVRGVKKRLQSNDNTVGEDTRSGVTSFNLDGWTEGSFDNQTNYTYIGWAWKAGNGLSSNGDGTITSVTSTNNQYGFSIVKYVGSGSNATIGHGLSTTPSFIIVKKSNNAGSFVTWHNSFGGASNTDYLYLNGQIDKGGDGSNAFWNNTVPTNSVFSVGTASSVNNSNDKYIAWCWSEISGFSKISSYTGNGSSTGPVVTTGFKPRYVLLKADVDGEDWVVLDTARTPTNPSDVLLSPNSSAQQFTHASAYDFDFLSNGFQPKNTNPRWNTLNETYYYIAFADRPGNDWFVNNINANATGDLDSTQNMSVNLYSGNGNEQRVGGPIYSNDPTLTGNGTLNPGAANAFNGNTDASDYCAVVAPKTSLPAAVTFPVSIENVTRVEVFVHSASSHGDTRGTCLDSTGTTHTSATLTGAASGYHDIYNGSAITLVNVGFGINQNGATGTSSDGFRAFRINGSEMLVDGNGVDLKFTPGLTWIKAHNQVDGHIWTDSSRGVNKVIKSNSDAIEFTASDALFQFNSDNGYTCGDNASNAQVNQSGFDYCSFAWKAGGTPVSNTDGNLTNVLVSANDDYGFSIVTYTGNNSASGGTLGHGLSSAPELIIIKNRDSQGHWYVYHVGITPGKALNLNQTDKEFTPGQAGITAVDDTLITFGSQRAEVNGPDNYVAYCWSKISGYSDFGKYIGTGAIGHKIVTGFKPAWILFRRLDSASNWRICNYLRSNVSLNAETAESEQSLNLTFDVDGFTINETGNNPNALNGEYIYSAFAAYPGNADEIDALIDTPTNKTASSGNNIGNYATFDPLQQTISATNGNLSITTSPGNKHYQATFGLSSGKWYWEMTPTTGSTPGMIGIALGTHPTTSNLNGAGAMSYYSVTGNKQGGNTSGVDVAYGATYTYGDVIGVALDLDSGTKTLTFYKNGISQGVAFNPDPTLGKWHPAVSAGSSVNTTTFVANFGQRPFIYPPGGSSGLSSEYKSVCTTNLGTPTIADGSSVFDVRSGLSAQFTINDLAFEPGIVVGKSTSNSEYWINVDVLRSFIGGLRWNDDDPQGSGAAITNVGSTGYQSDSNWFTTGRTYVTYNWDSGDTTESISVGGLNTSAYLTSQNWSNNAVTTGNGGNWSTSPSFAVTNAFNGDDSNYAHANADGSSQAVVTLTLNPPIACNSTVSFLGGVTSSGFGTISINGNPGTSLVPGGLNPVATDKTTVSFTGNVSTITIAKTQSTAAGLLVYGFEIDGKRLVNTNITPPSVPSLAADVRANTSAGCSVVTWTGQSSGAEEVPHGLGVAPDVILLKGLTGSVGWTVGHTSLGWTKRLQINTTAAESASSNYWNDTAPTNLVFTSGANNVSNTFVAYCFAAVEGYSAFGEYEGNGATGYPNADGPLVVTGFRPAFILVKSKTSAEHWALWDTSRDAFNYADNIIRPNEPNDQLSNYSTGEVDILSNGFKLRGNWGATNASGQTYIYLCFAEHPFKNSRAR